MSPPVCERAENGSCAAIIDAETPYGEADTDEPGRPGPAAPPSGPPANPEFKSLVRLGPGMWS